MNKQKKWAEASRPERRMMVAQDVLDQVEAGKILSSPGIYFAMRNNHRNPVNTYDDGVEIIRKGGTCEACAIGFIFYSSMKNYGYCKENHAPTLIGDGCGHIGFIGKDMIDTMSDAFSVKELRKMEFAFEGRSIGGTDFSLAERRDCENFHASNPSDQSRLTSIMKNILKNGGDFKP